MSLRSLSMVAILVLCFGVAATAQVELLYSRTGSSVGGVYSIGRRLVTLGDVNGDGIDDFAEADPWNGIPGVRVLSGATGFVQFTLSSASNASEFGQALAGPGDLDGDGVPDIVIGEPGSSVVGFDHGSVHAFSGATGLLLWTTRGSESDARLGHSICVVGDLDGDAVADLAVGIPRRDAPGGVVDAGGVFVLSGIDGSPLQAVTGTTPGGLLGWSCAAIGDLDADGFGDFVAGALYDDAPTALMTGAAHVYSGASGALLSSSFGSSSFARHGHAVSGAGDVDGDGVPDFMVSAPWEDLPGGLLDAGVVEIRSGASFASIHSIAGGAANRLMGTTLSAYGDLDGDGLDDVLITSGAGQPFTTGGAVRLHLGSDASVFFEILGGPGDVEFGAVLARADVDDDGVPDIAVGAPGGTAPRLHAFRVLPTQTLGGGQANGPAATLLIDDVVPGLSSGPFISYLKPHELHSFVVQGSPDALYSIYGSATLNPGGWLFPGFGSFDIGSGPAFLDVILVVDGFTGLLPIYAIDLGGRSQIDFLVPPSWPPGTLINVQALVQNTQPWQGGIWSKLSAAHRLVIL